MDVRSKQPIREHLLKNDVQERILQYIQKGRDEATVTISRAAELFGITENKLRDWEEYGFLNPLRPSGPKGRRLYTPLELDKLAIIRELINAGYAPSDIPPDIDKQWHTIRANRENAGSTEHHTRPVLQDSQFELPINIRIEQERKALFWRYFVSHALRLSLMLICENMPNTAVGLILPLTPALLASDIQRVEDIVTLGESLVGWLSQNRSSHILLTTRPSFQYSSDFRVEPLRSIKAGIPQESGIQERTIIIVQREANPLTLSPEAVRTIRRLLKPLYEEVELSRACFGSARRDVLDPATELTNTTNNEDVILTGLADMIIRLGGMNTAKRPRWRFCWIMLPKDPSQLLRLSSLVIRAQSQNAFYKAKSSISTSDTHTNSPYLKALRSGHVIYQPRIIGADASFVVRDLEEPIRSAIAVPIGGEDGIAVGVLYVASLEVEAFIEDDQRILRIMSRIVEELLKTYRVRQHVTQKLTDMVKDPNLVDTFFEDFAPEKRFIQDVEALLHSVQRYHEEGLEAGDEQIVSFIAVDIDKQGSLANKHGDRVVRNLAREVGLRVQEQIHTSFKEYPDCQLYHIYADRFLILLKHTSLEQAREHAERLRQGTRGSYNLDALRVSVDQHTRPESMIEIPDVTICLGVTSYSYSKLIEILHEHPAEDAITEVRFIITSALDMALLKGQNEGGNVVIGWDTNIHNFVRYAPPRNT